MILMTILTLLSPKKRKIRRDYGETTQTERESAETRLNARKSHFLVAALMVFQVTAMLLLAFKTDTVDWQAIAFAVAMPLVSQLVLRIFCAALAVDRTLMVLILFLCS